ncbi:hypothetical protein DL764_008521 [Monosporascus ibericus]|uniref:Uncharacterized protein n=1 Tax=Monosporascus ibericus TaxID=155417 RepID=A0A4Q4T0P1_9PEZI|nr:hypothetical protein DL764_008521 [Monosporascus ibericus]
MAQKSVLITGCSEHGIGAALALEFQRQGYQVFATARDVGKMEALAKQSGVRTLALDVTSDASIAAAVAEVGKATGGSLDVLVNNAGVQHVMPFADSTVADLRRVVDANFVGALAVTHALLPLLIAARGVVASVGSVNEVFHPPYQVAYNASKAAVHEMSNSLRVELKPLGVRFVTLMTGSVRTKLFDNAPTKLPEDSMYGAVRESVEGRGFLKNAKWVEPEDYAKQVVAQLLKDNPKRSVWAGGLATVAWVLSWLGWEGMLDSTMVKGNHLDKIQR